MPRDRFDINTHVDLSGKKGNTGTTPYGCFVDQPGLFDPSFFQISPREAAGTDPMQRLALTTAYEALEMSGYVPNRTASSMLDRVGTFYGQTLDDYREANASQEIDPFYVTGGLRPFGPVSHWLHYASRKELSLTTLRAESISTSSSLAPAISSTLPVHPV